MAMKLSRREREILDTLYATGAEASVEDIRERLSDPPSYSAVRAMLAKLETKGAIAHRIEGMRYVYAPTMPPSTARKAAISQLVTVFFGGSPKDTATALLKHERWSDDELDALRSQIDSVRRSRRSS